MADYLQWLNVLVWILLGAACVLLYFDGRGQRETLQAMQKTLGALQEQTTQHDAALGDHGARLVGLASRLGVVERAQAPRPPPVARSVVTVTRDDDPVHTRPTVEAPPPVGLAGDPPSTKPSRSRTVARSTPRPDVEEALHEEADARDARDAALPPEVTAGEDDGEEGRDTWEDATRMLDRGKLPPVKPPHAPPRRIASARPTMLGGLAGAPLERPTSSAKRTAEAFRREHPSSPTLLSEGVTRETLTPTDPGTTLDARVRRRWGELVAEAQEKGEEATHCYGERCMRRGEDIDLCACECEGCERTVGLLARAQREIEGV